MDDDDDLDLGFDYDRFAVRGDALIRLTAAHAMTSDAAAKALILKFMEKLVASVRVPTGELVAIEGGKLN